MHNLKFQSFLIEGILITTAILGSSMGILVDYLR